jgi:MFS family permease
LAADPGQLIIGRIGQGLAAAMIGATAIALMASSFPEGPRRTRALAVNGALLSLGFVIGTVGGGLITSGMGWRWTMLTLVILGLPVLAGALTVIPRDQAQGGARLDVPGATLATGGLFFLVYAISTGADSGWGSLSTVGSFTAATVLLGGFLVVEARHPTPLVPLRLLNQANVKWSGAVGFLTFGMCGGATVLLSLYMQDVLGYSALQTGFGFVAEGISAIVAGVVVAKVIDRIGIVPTMVLGLSIQAASTASMALLPAVEGMTLLLVTSGGMGFGHVLAIVSFVTVLTSGVQQGDQGVIGGLAQLPQFLGAIGVAGLAAVATFRTESLTGGTIPQLAILEGLHAAWLVAAAMLVIGIAIATTRVLPGR